MNANVPMIGPNVVDLSKATQPKPVDAEQVVVRTYRLPARATLPPSAPVLAGQTLRQEDFALTFNPQAAEIYLLIDGYDHRIFGLPDLLESWIKAMGGQASEQRPAILVELDKATIAVSDATALVEVGDSLPEAAERAADAVAHAEAALRLTRDLRRIIEQRLATAIEAGGE